MLIRGFLCSRHCWSSLGAVVAVPSLCERSGVTSAADSSPRLVAPCRRQVSISGDPDDDGHGGRGPASRGDAAMVAAPAAATPSVRSGRSTEVATIVDNSAEVIAANRDFLVAQARAMEENQLLQPPLHPQELIPAFVRVNRSAKLVQFKDETVDDLVQMEHTVRLPKAPEHPWVPLQPIGDFADIVHGDGMLNVVGSGEVGFDNERRQYPKEWRGLQPRFLTGLQLPHKNGAVSENLVVKYSLDRTGRGIFATRDIKKGDLLMCVRSAAVSLGYCPRAERLIDMMKVVLLRVHDPVRRVVNLRMAAVADPSRLSVREHVEELSAAEDVARAELEHLHTWIMQGQPSSLVEQWRSEHTERLIKRLGGRSVLDDLELHPLHIARLAAIMDMNSFVVEGYYNEDRGKGYWPEAGLFNHSCNPNADYDIMDDEHFKISDFNPEFVAARERFIKKQQEEQDQQQPVQHPTTNNDAQRATDQHQHQCSDPHCTDQHHHHHHRPSSGSEAAPQRAAAVHPVGSAQQQTAVAYYGEEEPDDSSMSDGALAPESSYLFVCRAARDIAAGEEVLISYVPPEWRYDNRQHVLYERYRFWCRCEKCAPSADALTKLYPRAMIAMVLVFLFLQAASYHAREHAIQGQENMDKGDLFPQSHFWGVTPDMKPTVDPYVQPPGTASVPPVAEAATPAST